MVCGIVQEDHSVISPVQSVLIQLEDQVFEEDFHDLGVRIGLGKAQIDITYGIYTSNHGNPRRYLHNRNGIG